jgi:hypothetical protein
LHRRRGPSYSSRYPRSVRRDENVQKGGHPPTGGSSFGGSSRLFYLIHVINVVIPYGSITYTQRKTPIIGVGAPTGFKDLTWKL